MKNAIKIRDLNNLQALFKLSESVSYGWGDDEGETQYVIASKSKSWGGVAGTWMGGYPTECLIFPATPSGSILDWGEIGGSYRCPGGHEQALEEMGFPVLQGESEPSDSDLGRILDLDPVSFDDVADVVSADVERFAGLDLS